VQNLSYDEMWLHTRADAAVLTWEGVRSSFREEGKLGQARALSVAALQDGSSARRVTRAYRYFPAFVSVLQALL